MALPAEIDQVANAVNGRTIDALIISGGGNDIGFASILTQCVELPGCQLWLNDPTAAKINVLPGKYAELNQAIAAKLQVTKVYLTEYPDSTRGDDGNVCLLMLADIIPGMAIDYTEAVWASYMVLAPLNQVMQVSAVGLGWKYVSRISGPFQGIAGQSGTGHGYCATNHWVRQAEESVNIQGPFSDKTSTKGTMHPSVVGHAVYAQAIYGAVAPDLVGFGTEPVVWITVPDSRPGTGLTARIGFSGVTQTGSTTLRTSEGAPAAPTGFRPGAPALVYDLQTAMQYTQGAHVCIKYGADGFTNPSLARLFHYENGVWVDVTSTVDTAARRDLCLHAVVLALRHLRAEPAARPAGRDRLDDGSRRSGAEPDGRGHRS